MALLGYKLVLKVGGSIIAASTDVNLDITGEALETTTQTSEMNAEFMGGKVSGTASGSYLLAADGSQWASLFTLVNAGTTLSVSIERNGSPFISCDGVLTSIGLSGANSDSLVTGSYSIQLSGDPAI